MTIKTTASLFGQVHRKIRLHRSERQGPRRTDGSKVTKPAYSKRRLR